MFNTGARVQELLDIRTVDLQLDRPAFVRLHGKGRKERLCPLWPETATAVQALLRFSRVSPEDSKPIFRNHRGEPMTRFGVRYLMRQYAERARTTTPTLVAKRVHPHTGRHYSEFRTITG
jgi:site-specific recombinase XerD